MRPHPLLALLLVLTALPVAAQVTVYRFTGTVATVGGDLGATVQAGNTFQADFAFDESVAYGNDIGSTTLYKSKESSVQIVTGGSGTLTWSLSNPTSNNLSHGFSVANNSSGYDQITFSTPGSGDVLTGPTLNSETVSTLYFNLRDNTQAVFSSEAIPTSLNLASFGLKQAYLYFGGQTTGETITFTLTNIEKNPSAVPEPATYATVLGGLVLTGAILRRRLARTLA